MARNRNGKGREKQKGNGGSRGVLVGKKVEGDRRHGCIISTELPTNEARDYSGGDGEGDVSLVRILRVTESF